MVPPVGEIKPLAEQLLPAIFAVRRGGIGAVLGAIGIVRIHLIVFRVHASRRGIEDFLDVALDGLQPHCCCGSERYAYHPVTWEIWNEPDSPIFLAAAAFDPDSYAQFVSLTCSAIKTAVPNATVLAPSTAAQPISAPLFYRAIAESEASGRLNGLSNSYRMQSGKEPAPESVQADNVASRALLKRIYPRWAAVPVLCTEWGYPSLVVGPKTQSAYLGVPLKDAIRVKVSWLLDWSVQSRRSRLLFWITPLGQGLSGRDGPGLFRP